MISEDKKVQILRLFKDGESIKEIVRQTGIARNTVRRVIRNVKSKKVGRPQAISDRTVRQIKHHIIANVKRASELPLPPSKVTTTWTPLAELFAVHWAPMGPLTVPTRKFCHWSILTWLHAWILHFNIWSWTVPTVFEAMVLEKLACNESNVNRAAEESWLLEQFVVIAKWW